MFNPIWGDTSCERGWSVNGDRPSSPLCSMSFDERVYRFSAACSEQSTLRQSMRVAASYEGQQLDQYCRGRCKAAASIIFPSLGTSAQPCTPAVCLPAWPA